MLAKRFPILTILLITALLFAACTAAPTSVPTAPSDDTALGEQPIDEQPAAEQPPVAEQPPAEAPAGQTGTTEQAPEPPAQAAPSGFGTIVQRVRDRGQVVCGGRTDLAGFGFLDDSGRNAGFDVDLCRAVAVAMFGDPDAVEIVPITAAERGPALQTGEVDILARTATWTSSRDAQWGEFVWIMFYDGQGFVVPADSGITTIEELDGATICVTSGTTTELNLADAFRQRGLDFSPLVFEDTASVYTAYEEGRCDAATSDLSQLAAVRSGFADPSAHVLLDITISKEPLTPAVPTGDSQWFDIVKMVMFGLINAEELGVNQANVEEMKSSENIEVRRLLGAEGDWGQSDLGLPPDAIAQVISALGNYGEIYDRYMGPEGMSFELPRGLNDLWTNGGLMYAPPLR